MNPDKSILHAPLGEPWQPSESQMLPPRPETVKAIVDLQMYQLMAIADMRRADQQERYFSHGEIQAAAQLSIRYATDDLGGIRVAVNEGMGS